MANDLSPSVGPTYGIRLKFVRRPHAREGGSDSAIHRTRLVRWWRSNVFTVIPLPRPWLLASALLVGSAVGLLAGVALNVLVHSHSRVRPDLVIALVASIPSVIGLGTILLSGRRWVTMAGAFILGLAPGWLAVLVAIQAASHA